MGQGHSVGKGAVWTPTGHLAVCDSNTGKVTLWDYSGKCLKENAQAITYHPTLLDGSLVLVAGQPSEIYQINVGTKMQFLGPNIKLHFVTVEK